MNWVRNILRLVCALVVCWGVGVAACYSSIGLKKDGFHRLQILSPTPCLYSKDRWFGGVFEGLSMDRNPGDHQLRPTGFGPQTLKNLDLLPQSFRAELDRAPDGTDPVSWIDDEHYLMTVGLPVPCWLSHNPEFVGPPYLQVSWRAGIVISPEWPVFPIRPRPLPLAINLAFWYCVIWGAERLVVHLRGWRRERKGVCVKCAYPKPEGAAVCPECGTAF